MRIDIRRRESGIRRKSRGQAGKGSPRMKNYSHSTELQITAQRRGYHPSRLGSSLRPQASSGEAKSGVVQVSLGTTSGILRLGAKGDDACPPGTTAGQRKYNAPYTACYIYIHLWRGRRIFMTSMNRHIHTGHMPHDRVQRAIYHHHIQYVIYAPMMYSTCDIPPTMYITW